MNLRRSMNDSFLLLGILFMTSCNFTPTSTTPTNYVPQLEVPTLTNTIAQTETHTPSPTLTYTLVPTETATKTPRPTQTPLPELTEGDVGLIWNPSDINGPVIITPCYMFTSDRFHAGDQVDFPSSQTAYSILAPTDGIIISAEKVNDSIGYEVNVQTPYILNGKTVYYDIVHSNGLVPGLHEGSEVRKGSPIVIKNGEMVAPQNKWLIDIAFRNSMNKQANASLDGWTGLGFLSYTRLIQDDLASLDSSQFYMRPTCAGNPINQSSPYQTPTPGGFTFP
jgi:hypothetical protein